MRGTRTSITVAAAAMLTAALVLPAGAQEPPLRIEMFGPHFKLVRAAPAEPVSGVYANSVAADIVIGLDGRVESVRVLKGNKAHHASAVAALKTYQFAPVVVNGRPTRAILQISVHVPDTGLGSAPAAIPNSSSSATVRARPEVTLMAECSGAISQMTAKPGAIATCRRAVEATDRSSATTPSDRRTVRIWLGDAHLFAGQWADAITAYEAASGVRVTSGDDDVKAGELLAKMGMAHLQLGDLEAADRRVAAAVAKVEGATASGAEQRRARDGSLDAIYRLGATIKRLRGDGPAAEALERKAAALSVPM